MTRLRLRQSSRLALVLALSSLAATACVEDVGTINRTGPDLVDKEAFEGVWYYWQTVADAPYSTASAFTGQTNFGGEAKLIFEVSEDFLIAYPVVAAVDGAEEEFRLRKIRKYWDKEHRDEFVEIYAGQPIAVWPINHYDVIRNYNTYNGAQSNELVENSTDRPWYERDYVRVEWHDQQMSQLFFSLFGGVGGDSYFVGDDKDGEPDEMTIDKDGGYIDFVVRSKVNPSGQSRCSIFGLSPYDCAEAIVKVRHSFRRADPKRDYEPIRYHNMEHQDKFGFFLTERPHYDEDYGPSYAGSISWANRWNLWDENFDFVKPTDAEGQDLDVECFNDFECDEEIGERCQKDTSAFDMGYCAKPTPRAFAQRELRPVVYHLSADWHPTYMAEAYASAEGFNDMFRETVSWQLFYEEQGQYDVRGCSSHSDCLTGDVLFDTSVPVDYDAIPCHADADCGAVEDTFCGQDKWCATAQACGDTDGDSETDMIPCKLGQTCSGGVCMEGGEVAEYIVDTVEFRGSTVVYYGDGAIVTHDNFSNDTLGTIAAGGTFVRFVHAAPDAGDLSLTVNGVTLQGGDFDAAMDYDPQDPLTASFMASVPAGVGLDFVVNKGGSEVATTVSDLVANNSYLVVFNGDDVIVAGATFNDSKQGVRFIHAAKGGGKLDFALTGVRLDKAVGYRQSTDYQDVAGSLQRVTVTTAGTRGDLTCYTEDTIGRCVGWGADVTTEDLKRRLEIKSSLPDIFLLCENEFDPKAASDQANIDDADDTKTTVLGTPCQPFPNEDEDNDGEPDEGELPMTCPNGMACPSRGFCHDAIDQAGHFGDAWYSTPENAEWYGQGAEDLEVYNPCGDVRFVAKPMEQKKIGDIRYSYFYWINEMMRAGPLGYGPSYADPETGQLISGTANIYGAAVHTYSQYAADLIALVNGDLSAEEVITGAWIQEYLKSKGLGDGTGPGPDKAEDFQSTTFSSFAEDLYGEDKTDEAAAAMPTDALTFEGHEGHEHGAPSLEAAGGLAAPLADFFKTLPGTESSIAGAMVPDYMYPEMMELMRDPALLKQKIETELPMVDPGYFQSRMDKIRGHWLEDLLINNEIMTAAEHLDPEGELSWKELKDQLSPASWATQHAIEQEELRTQWFMKQNMYMADFVDDSLWGLAKELKETMGLDGEELRIEVGRRILRGVLEHEIGHTVGLRHNFSGSTDVFNFFDEYYSIREKEVIVCPVGADEYCDQITGQACVGTSCSADTDCLTGFICQAGDCSAPDPKEPEQLIPAGVCAAPQSDTVCASASQCGDGELCFNGQCFEPVEQFVPRVWMTDNEKAAKRTEYQYTSIMDYGGRFNSDFVGLGKYDYAAIQFGYSQLVDTYVDTSHCWDRVDSAANLQGGQPQEYSWYCNSRFWPTRGTGFFHSFNYLTNYIGVEQNLKRMPRPYEQVKYQREMVVNDDREYFDMEYIEVPYAFCSDEYRGNMGCYYFDMGIDMGEMARHATDQLEQYYLFDAFKRERLYFGLYGSPFRYFGRIMDRYMRVLGDVGMFYGFYKVFLFRYGWFQSWLDNPLGGRTMDLAAREAFGNLINAVSSPAPGSYRYDDDKDAYENISLQTGHPDSELDIPFGIGRFPYTQFGYQLGYTYAEHPLWFGSFWEKIAALLTLTDSTAYFVDQFVGEQSVNTGTAVGFNTVFSDEMNSFLGGIIADDMNRYTGRLIQGKYTPPSIAMRDTVGEMVEPALNNFTLKLYAALYGLAYLPAGFDPRFIDATAVFMEGDTFYFDHAVVPGVVEHRFEDPIGGKVYVAYSNNYGADGSDSISAGAVMVDRAQDLADQWEESSGAERLAIEGRLADVVELLDVLRGYNQIFGTNAL